MKKYDFPLSDWLSEKEEVKFDLGTSSVECVDISELGELDMDFDLGHPDKELEEEAERKIKEFYTDEVHPIVTSGAQAGNSIVFDSLLEDGDEVRVEDPVYSPLKSAPAIKGAKVSRFERNYENDFKIDVQEIREKSSEDTKIIVLTNPHNPSGVYQSPQELSELKDFLEDNDIYLLADEIYREFIDGAKSLVSLSDKVLITSSLSKVYGFGGSRFGYLLSTDPKLIEKIGKVKKIVSPHNPPGKLKMGIKVLENRDRLLERSRDIAEKGRSLAQGWIRGSKDIEWVEPSPGIISFPRLNVDCDGDEFSRKAKEAGVLTTPGSYFSDREEFRSHIRLTFGKNFQQMAQGFQILSRVIAECKK